MNIKDEMRLDQFKLIRGGGSILSLCIMQLVGVCRGEGETSSPYGFPFLLRAYLISVNDRANDKERQRLKPLAPILARLEFNEATDRIIDKLPDHFVEHPPAFSVDAAIGVVRSLVAASESQPLMTADDERWLAEVEKGKIKSKLAMFAAPLALVAVLVPLFT